MKGLVRNRRSTTVQIAGILGRAKRWEIHTVWIGTVYIARPIIQVQDMFYTPTMTRIDEIDVYVEYLTCENASKMTICVCYLLFLCCYLRGDSEKKTPLPERCESDRREKVCCQAAEKKQK